MQCPLQSNGLCVGEKYPFLKTEELLCFQYVCCESINAIVTCHGSQVHAKLSFGGYGPCHLTYILACLMCGKGHEDLY